MKRAEYAAQYLSYHKAYETRAFKIFRRAIKASYEGMPFDSITYDNYKLTIPLNVQYAPIFNAYVEVYRTIGLIHGNRIGQGINRDIKDYSKPLFNEEFQRTIAEWVRENCGLRITSVIDTVAKRISSLVEFAIGENYTIEQMQRYLREQVGKNVFTRYQALRIARTETTSASNHAAMVSGETSGIVLVKEWIATRDARTRRKPEDQFDHYVMNGNQVEQNEKFVLRSKDGIVDEIDYPGDPNGSAGDTISCRCALALVPKRDENGFVIRR